MKVEQMRNLVLNFCEVLIEKFPKTYAILCIFVSSIIGRNFILVDGILVEHLERSNCLGHLNNTALIVLQPLEK